MQMMTKKYSGDTKFKKVLSKLDCVLDIYSIRSLISGYVWGIEMVPPSQILEEIPFRGEEGEAGPQNEQEAGEFFEGFFGLWNLYVDDNTKKIRKVRPLPKDITDADEIMSCLYGLSNDMNVFMGAMQETGTEELVNMGLQMVILEIIQSIDEVDGFLAKVQGKEDLSQAEFRDAVSILCVNRYRWENSYHILGKELKKEREHILAGGPMFGEDEEFIDEDGEFESDMILDEILSQAQKNENSALKVGRNENCYCESGKKYKKCCMLKVVELRPGSPN